ncbi:AAA family ATPase [Peribacillus simplex]|uniref:ATP-binding protein n=1 Tax=Peribacillus simplex TaxID=1478 RepID=UPI003CF420D3
MTAYKIKKILIENFKSVERAILDFSEKTLIVLDGPNGFGKTTIFDAIELVVRGQISRVINTVDGRYGYNDLLFSRSSDKDTIIKIEFCNGNQSFTVVKRYDCSVPLKSSERRPNNWGLFETYLLENFEDSFLGKNPVEPEQIYSRLEIDDFNRYFSLFYYIQQEENTYFLKKPAKDRMNEISQLFDSYKEQLETEKLQRLKSELDKEKRKIGGDRGLLAQKKQMLGVLRSGLQDMDESKHIQVEYFQLIQGLSTLREWDKKDISVQKEARDRYLIDLQQLKDFVKNFDEFLKAQSNKVIQKNAENKKLLYDTIICVNFLDQYEELKEMNSKEKNLRSIKSKMTKENIRMNLNSFPLQDIETLIEKDVDFKAIQEKLQLLKEYKNNANDLSSILQELNTTRDTLLEHFEKLNHLSLENNESCPLCGHDWKSYEQLIQNVQSKREAFRKYYDVSSEKFENELNSLFADHLEPIRNWINEYLMDNKKSIDQTFFEQLTESYKRKQTIIGFIEWCRNNHIDINTFLNRDQKAVTNLEAKGEELADFLMSKKHLVKEGHTEFDENLSKLESLFQDLFESNEKRVRLMTLDQIERKIDYINYQYYHRSSKSIKQLANEVIQLQTRLQHVEIGIEKIKNIVKIYTHRIGQHWKKIMRDIEIPFYIYSGKILQDYQRGLGLFIQDSEGDGVKSIKFVSNFNSDHDAVNYLSSGQLSGLVIAFTLALNKVYGNNSMDVLLIDDPVQTMDEINMASFVELLRNEFKDKQILLSTHEEDVSRYIRYKFKKYNLDTMRFNVKERLYIDY